MPSDFRREEQGRGFNRRRDNSPPRQQPRGRDGGGSLRSGPGHAPPPRRVSRSRSPLLQLHHQRNKAEARERERERGFYESYNQESQHRQSREKERRSPPVKSRIVHVPPPRHLRMDDPPPQGSVSRNRMENRDKERRQDDRNTSLGSKRNANSNSVFADLDRVVKRARETKDPSYWNKKVMEVEEQDPNRWGHSGFKELYPNEKRGGRQKDRPEASRRSRSRSPPPSLRKPPPREEPKRRSRSPRTLLPRRSRTPPPLHRRDPIGGQKSLPGPRRNSPPPPRGGRSNGATAATQSSKPGAVASRSGQSKDVRSSTLETHHRRRDDQPPPKKNESSSRPASEIGNRKQHVEKSSGGGAQTAKKSNIPRTSTNQQQKPPSRPNSGKDSKQGDTTRPKERSRNSSISDAGDSSRTPSPQLKKKAEAKDQQRRTPVRSRSSSSSSSSDEDVLEIHARDRRQSLSNSSSDEDSISDDSVRKLRSHSFSSSPSDSSDEGSGGKSKGRQTKTTNKAAKINSRQKKGTKSSSSAGPVKAPEKTAKKDPPKKGSPNVNTSAKEKEKGSDSGGVSESESESSSESEEEPKMTLSERFAKLTQMSRDKREFAKPEISINDIDTKLKVVKDLRNADTKVFVNAASKRPTSAKSRPKSPDFNEGEGRYPADDRRRHFERMTRDEPLDRDRPRDWSDVRVRFNYYKSRGYFDERPLTLEEYSKWEAWWYEYRDWLAEEGYYDQQQTPPPAEFHRGGPPPGSGNGRRPRDDPPPPLSGQRNFHDRQRNFQGRPQPEPLLARPIRFDGIRYEEAPMDQQILNRVPISRRIGHATGGSLLVNIRPPIHQGQQGGNFRGRGRLAGRIGFRR